MSTHDNAEWLAERTAGNFLNDAMRTVAGRCGLEKSLERDPAAFAIQFAPLLGALIEAQSRNFHALLISESVGDIAAPLASASHELSVFFTRLYDKQAAIDAGERGQS